MTRGERILAALLLLAGLVPAAGQGSGAQAHPVRARLVVDAAPLAPGDSFAVGVVLEMAPGWHTYWAFPGDAGLATKVEWRVPEGFRVGPLQWPGPHRYVEAGDLTAFGYADEVLLLAPVRAPASLPDTVTVGAEVSWLVCRETCIPGDTTLTLRLRPGTARAETGPFARHRPSVPTAPLPDDPVSWTARVRAEVDGALAVAVAIRADAVDAQVPDFFPLEAGAGAYVESGDRTVAADGTVRAEARVVAYGGQPPPQRLSGVLAFAGADGRRQFRSVSVDLTARAGAIDLRRAEFGLPAADGRGLWVFISMAVVGGLILNLMPCVLPVISLKAISLVSQAGAETGTVRRLGLAFGAGVVAAFVALAIAVIAVRAGGQQVGWGFQFQSPAFVVFLAALVFVLALSLFGVVAIRLPGGGGSLGGLADAGGAAGSFANGVLATILATPCTAPFLGTALGFAFSQPAATTVAVFAAAGAGMALPYALLAWRPAWIRYLPRPGAWMERFKQAMGFLLMATVVWLLWVLGRQLGMEGVVWTVAFLLCLAVGAWVLGSWVDLASSGRARAAAWGAALLIAASGYAGFLHPLLTSAAPAAAAVPTEARWQPFRIEGVEALLEAGRPVFVDFTADWCWTCKVNERTVLADPEVLERFDALDIALVKADWTRRDPEITRLLQSFGRSGVPLYVLFPAGRADAPIVLPEVITAGIVLDRLERAAALASP